MNQSATRIRPRALVAGAAVVLAATWLSGCEELPPRSYGYYLDDRLAREGTIALCDQKPVEMAENIECANARRAAAAVALRIERERREELERESQRKLAALRLEMAERERAVREAALAAARAEREAYEALWRERSAALRAETQAPAGETMPQAADEPLPSGDLSAADEPSPSGADASGSTAIVD